MPFDFQQYLVIGISSRALFDLETENYIYETEGLARKYAIDHYQREYRWGKEQVTDLLDDLATGLCSPCGGLFRHRYIWGSVRRRTVHLGDQGEMPMTVTVDGGSLGLAAKLPNKTNQYHQPEIRIWCPV